jgi:hypothetical protein
MIRKRLLILLMVSIAVCAGCEDGDSSATDTSLPVEPSAVSTSSASVTTTDSTPTSRATTTDPSFPQPGRGVLALITTDDGVYQVEPEGTATLLVDGAVAHAVDDTQGGLLFQLERARAWDESAPNDLPTVIWWIPRGADRPQELLVPTPGAGHRLTLHDAYPTDEGFAVLYTRHEGSMPDDMIDTLRRFEVSGGTVTVLRSQGAFEQGFGDVSSNGELIAATWYQQVGSGCFIADLDGVPVDIVPRAAADPNSESYVQGCRLSAGGDRLAFFTRQYDDNHYASTTIDLWDLVTDKQAHRFVVPSGTGDVAGIDMAGAHLLANRMDENLRPTTAVVPMPGLVWNLEEPTAAAVELPIAGFARFAHAPVDITGPVEAPASVAESELVTIAGAVFEDLNGDGAPQADEPGAQWLVVEVQTPQGETVSATSSGPDGSFVIHVHPGSYVVAPILGPTQVTTTTASIELELGEEGVQDLEFGVSSCAGWKVTKLLNPDPEEDGRFGFSVDVDGDRVVVDTWRGDIYLYEKSATGWFAEQIRVADGRDTFRPYESRGKSVTIEGATIVAGDPLAAAVGDDSGAVHVYELEAGTWTEHLLIPEDLQHGAELGISVAIDGDRIIAGAPKDSAAVTPPGNYSGAAYVFERVGSKWEAERLESPEPAPWDWFGASVAVAGDTVAVAEAVAFEESTAGTVFAFEYVAGDWVGHRIASADDDQLGWSLAAGEGVIVAGAPEWRILESVSRPGVEPGTGYAYLLTEARDGYATTRIEATNGRVGGLYGIDMDLSEDRLIIGAPHHLQNGAAFLYPLPWSGAAETVCAAWDGTSSDHFGGSVAIDRNTIVVGAQWGDEPFFNSGAVYIFEAP